ncbi:MAG: carboxypeptidase regulatory-like domain-containing protein [Bacteroidales bacterium]|nr:carboxypeptidase regulatory-like domain-containing protein [Bacteroidales bacterium]
MKKIHFLVLVFLIVISLPLSAQTGDQKSGGDKSEFDIPADFFDNMFRAPSDKFLVAWHGGVKITLVDSKGGTTVFSGSVRPFEKILNEGFNDLFGSYFTLNMKDGKSQIVSPNENVWAARCGLKSSNNINISPATGKEIKGFPAEITSDVWSKAYIVKRSYNDPVSHKKIVEQYRLEATSIYYYDKSKNDLEGSIKRDDGYKPCGKLLFQLRGPGMKGMVVENTKIENEKYHFGKVLHRGDYDVSYMWPHGGRIVLDEDFVFNPSNPKMAPNFTIPAFTGKIQGKVIYNGTDIPVKNYRVRIVPACSSSGLPVKETKTDGDGIYTFDGIPAGEYYVVVKGSENTKAFLIKKGETLKPKDSEISFFYKVRAYYNAPGFAKVGLKWDKTSVQFPDKKHNIKVLNVKDLMNMKNRAEMEASVTLPFTIVFPTEKKTFYGGPGDNPPTVLYATSLGGNGLYKNFDVKVDGLTSCEIVQINNGPIYLYFRFDLFGGAGPKSPNHQINKYWQQVNVTCWEPAMFQLAGQKMKKNSDPVDFPPIYITEEDIEKFERFEKVEKTISNGRATLKVVFEPLEE